MMMQNFEVQILDWNDKPVKFNMFNLLQLKHALALEMKGLKMSGNRSTHAHLRKLLSAPKNFKIEQMHQYISDCIDNINEQIGVK